MKTCATCRFMAADRYGIDGSSSGHNTCVRIIHGNAGSGYYINCPVYDDGTRESADEEANARVHPNKEPAAVLDGSGYAARLVVLPSFGCILHEDRPTSDPTSEGP